MSDLEANLVESGFRFLHVLGAVVWLGFLYHLDWVLRGFAQGLDGATRRALLPRLLGPALYWVRWSAAVTWVTGVLMLALVAYRTHLVPPGVPAAGALAITFGGVAVYELAVTRVLRAPLASFWGGWALLSAAIAALHGLGLPPRAVAVHAGGLAASVMAFNVWFRVWPAQRDALERLARGQAPDPARAAAAARRLRHNTMLSVPVVMLMLAPHATTSLYAGPSPALSLAILALAGLALAQGAVRLAERAASPSGDAAPPSTGADGAGIIAPSDRSPAPE